MAGADNQLIEQLKDVGNRLLHPPSSTPELLNLLDEAELLFLKVGQQPSQVVQEAILLSMKALIADEFLKNSDADIKITVAACLNEIMRISAPVAPYDDDKMKEIFELIVSSIDNLSCLPGRCYSKAVLILESIARLRSCVMLLDLDCDPLVMKMFELFLKNISSNHPHSVFLAMETIMSVMINESDAVSLELLKILLASIKKENQNFSPTSWKLGSRVIEQCTEKLKPYIIQTVTSMDSCLEDYAPVLSLICKDEPAVRNVVDDPAKPVENQETTAVQHHPTVYVQGLEAVKRCSRDVTGTESGNAASRRGRKLNPQNTNEGYENLIVKGKSSAESPRGRLKKSSVLSKSEEKVMPALEDVASEKTEQAADLEHKKQLHQASLLGDNSKKKGTSSMKDVSGGSGNKSRAGPSRKDKDQGNDAPKAQRKRASSDDDVIETPHGRKRYKDDLVGCKIKVWWPLDRRYYEGTVTSFDASTKRHKVDYDDGDEEILNLRKERWEFVGDEIVADIDLFFNKQTPQPSSDVSQREASREGERETSQTDASKSGGITDSGAESGDGSNQESDREIDDRRGSSEFKKPRLSNGQKF